MKNKKKLFSNRLCAEMYTQTYVGTCKFGFIFMRSGRPLLKFKGIAKSLTRSYIPDWTGKLTGSFKSFLY